MRPVQAKSMRITGQSEQTCLEGELSVRRKEALDQPRTYEACAACDENVRSRQTLPNKSSVFEYMLQVLFQVIRHLGPESLPISNGHMVEGVHHISDHL